STSPTQLVFLSAPGSVQQTSGDSFSPRFTLALKDAQGHTVVTDSTTLVSVSLTASAQANGFTLLGSTITTLRKGIARFNAGLLGPFLTPVELTFSCLVDLFDDEI